MTWMVTYCYWKRYEGYEFDADSPDEAIAHLDWLVVTSDSYSGRGPLPGNAPLEIQVVNDREVGLFFRRDKRRRRFLRATR